MRARGRQALQALSVIHTEASLGWGGQELRILAEAEGLGQRGHCVTILCPPEATILDEAHRRGLAAHPLPIGRKGMAGCRALYRWLKDHSVNVINTHSSTDSWLAAVASRFLSDSPALVRTRHISAPVPNNAPTRWLYQRATRHIVTTGSRLREQLIQENCYDPGSITSIPTGVDERRFVPGPAGSARRALELPEDGTLIGIVATLRSWKGHRYLIEAFAKMAREDVHLVIVGDGPQQESIRKQVHSLGIEARVHMPGSQRNVLPWLQALDVFALPSYANEGVPQAIVQAMLCALPVISTPVGSIPEVVHPEKTGVLVPPRDVDALASAITRLLDTPDHCRALGEAARKYAAQHFSLARMLDAMEAVYATVLP